jgi:hypothetical protein
MKIASKSLSKDIEDRRASTGKTKGFSLREGYRELVQQPLATAKGNINYVKEQISPSGSLKGFEKEGRAARDLGGPRTPPYGGKQ